MRALTTGSFMCRALLVLTLVADTSCSRVGRSESLRTTPYEPLRISAVSEDTAFTVTVDGRLRLVGDELEVIVVGGTIRYDGSGGYAGRREISTLAVALAQGEQNGYWRVAGRGRPERIRRIVPRGGEVTLDSLHFTLPRRAALDEYWLVLEIENQLIDIPPVVEGRGVSYVHGPREALAKLVGR